MWQASVQAKGIKFEGSYKLTLLAVRPDKRKRDLDNLFKAASDCLVAAGIVDDSKCEWLEGRWVKEGPQCTLVIEEINNDD
jgi:Holliday junction resolvase RusA-like endonuclease